MLYPSPPLTAILVELIFIGIFLNAEIRL